MRSESNEINIILNGIEKCAMNGLNRRIQKYYIYDIKHDLRELMDIICELKSNIIYVKYNLNEILSIQCCQRQGYE